jgi:hypothetical protein
MEGSILQLGLGNYLINNKSKKESFFKHTYKNYSNFAKHTKKIDFKGTANFGNRVSLDIDREANYGDFITNIILVMELPSTASLTTSTGRYFGYCNGVGNAIIDNCDLKIGGNYVDQQDGLWMDIWGELGIPKGKQTIYQNMIKKSENHDETYFQGGKVRVPLMFWFCQSKDYNDHAHFLPLLSMRDNEIELILKFKSYNDVLYSTDDSLPTSTQNMTNAYLLIDYVILEEEERLDYLRREHQMYLINQVQSQSYSVSAGTINLNISMRNFKYPIIEFFLIVRRNDNTNSKIYFNYGNTTSVLNNDTPISKMRLSFDGKDRIEELDAEFFCQDEPSKVHDNVDNSFIHCYSFALEPENLGQPSGSCNFSEIYEPMLHITFKSGITASMVYLYAVNYNVLQIDKSGNSWLLHNLSKSAPTTLLNDPNKC